MKCFVLFRTLFQWSPEDHSQGFPAKDAIETSQSYLVAVDQFEYGGRATGTLTDSRPP